MTAVTRDHRGGFLRLDPLPTPEEVAEYYASEFYDRANTSYVNDSSLENLEEEAEFHRRAYEDHFRLLDTWVNLHRPLSHCRVADIGSGFGHWLAFLREKGVSGYGVEPVESGVEFTRSMGIETYQLGVEDMTAPPGGAVDVVTMINVLEHLRDPFAALVGFRENWLKPGGWILIRVPNDFNDFQVAANELHDLGEWWVAAPRHINYFSHVTLRALLDHAGYETVASTSTFPLEMFLLMGDIYVGDPAVGKDCHRKRVLFERSLELAGHTEARSRLYEALASAGLGREVVLLAQAR